MPTIKASEPTLDYGTAAYDAAMAQRWADERTCFPVGATVLVDGERKARVVQHFPEGSTSYAFPHYCLTEGGWLPSEHVYVGEVFVVGIARVSAV